MAASQTASVKQRKMAAGQATQQPGGRSALRALRIALARSARDLFDLPLAVIGATQTRCAQAMLGKYLGDGRMLVVLDGPDRLVGALSIDRESLTSIIQQQTMGTVTGGPPPERGFTGTDAAMVAPLLDEMLKRAAATADVVADKRCLSGYRFGAKVDDLRSLILAIESERFRVFDLTLEFASGVQQGRICLALPEPEEIPAEDGAEVSSGPRLDRAAGAARAELSAVIGHLRLPLADLAEMRPGDLLPLHDNHLDKADLVAINGARIASVRLGQIGGMRAVRLNESTPRVMPSGQAQFHAGTLSMPPGGMPASLDLLKMKAGTGLPQATVDVNEDGGGSTLDMDGFDLSGLPSLDIAGAADDEDSLAALSPAQAALQISELAGLSLDDTGEDDA